MNTLEILSFFLPMEISEDIYKTADVERYETLRYWKEISKQPKLNRFPIKKESSRIKWSGWFGDTDFFTDYRCGLCINCSKINSIYNDKIFIQTNDHFIDYCSRECMMDGPSWDYTRYEDLKNKYAS